MTDWEREGQEVRAIALDIDGTLAGTDHRVSDRTVATVRRLVDQGVLPIIITGRTEGAARRISDLMGLSSPIISCNGAIVTDPATNQHLKRVYLESGTVSRIIAFGQERKLDVIVWTGRGMVTDRPGEGADLLEDVNEEPVTIEELGPEQVTDAVKVMLSGSPLVLDGVQDEIRDLLPLMERSMDRFYESSIPGATKREALRLVLDILGIPHQHCMGIADGDTDAGWLADIGVAVAVRNARKPVQDVAQLHIGHHGDESVAFFLESYFAMDSPGTEVGPRGTLPASRR